MDCLVVSDLGQSIEALGMGWAGACWRTSNEELASPSPPPPRRLLVCCASDQQETTRPKAAAMEEAIQTTIDQQTINARF